MRLGSRWADAVPSADGQALRRAARRHAAARILLAVALVGLVGTAVAVARRLDPQESAVLPRDRNAVVVLDLSKSVEAAAYDRVARVLADVVAARKPVGLIVFSDAAYELFPPGSPAGNVEPLLRYFTPVRGRGAGAQYPPNPWQLAFSGGTNVSSAVELALQVLRRDRVERGSVLLVSDLDVPLSDVAALTNAVSALRRAGGVLRVVPLFPNADSRYIFERIVGRDAFVDPRRLPGVEARLGARAFAAPSERALLLVAVLLLLLVAANERWCGRLQLPWRALEGER
jgi:hypothetical protein